MGRKSVPTQAEEGTHAGATHTRFGSLDCTACIQVQGCVAVMNDPSELKDGRPAVIPRTKHLLALLCRRLLCNETPLYPQISQGIVYITDETSRHEVTSWRLDQAGEGSGPPVFDGGLGGTTTHVVVVVDSSGSMRKEDVPGYNSRTAAVCTRAGPG